MVCIVLVLNHLRWIIWTWVWMWQMAKKPRKIHLWFCGHKSRFFFVVHALASIPRATSSLFCAASGFVCHIYLQWKDRCEAHTWTPQYPLGPRKRSHSSAMSVHFQLNRCTIAVPCWQFGVLKARLPDKNEKEKRLCRKEHILSPKWSVWVGRMSRSKHQAENFVRENMTEGFAVDWWN